MAYTRQNIGTVVNAANTDVTPLTVSYPASGIIAGDLLLYIAGDNNAGTTLTWSNTPTQLSFNSTNTTRGIWATLAAGSENGGTVTVSSSSTGRIQAYILHYRGAPGTLTGIVNDSASAGGSAATGLSWATLTPTVDGCLCLFAGGKSNAGSITDFSAGPAGSTELVDVSTGTVVSVCNEIIQMTAAVITTGSWTIANDASGSRRVLGVALLPDTTSTTNWTQYQRRRSSLISM